MAHSVPTAIDNHGDARRLTLAGGVFIMELAIVDKRVEAYYGRWYHAHEDAIGAMCATPRHEAVPAAARFHADRLETTRRFVIEDLHLPEAWSQSIAEHLTDLFRRRSYMQRHPGTDLTWGFPVWYDVRRSGKWPARNGKDIERNVRWFYRVHVKGESIHDLARDYQSWADRTTEARSVIQNGIKQARALLELAFTGIK